MKTKMQTINGKSLKPYLTLLTSDLYQWLVIKEKIDACGLTKNQEKPLNLEIDFGKNTLPPRLENGIVPED